jgi:hypothetical protein
MCAARDVYACNAPDLQGALAHQLITLNHASCETATEEQIAFHVRMQQLHPGSGIDAAALTLYRWRGRVLCVEGVLRHLVAMREHV